MRTKTGKNSSSTANLLFHIWTRVFRLIGSRSRISGSTWTPAGGKRILVIAVHPDDEAAGCACTIRAHLRAGDSVQVAYLTDGSKSRALGLSASEMRQRRRQEADKAAAYLGVAEWLWCGLPEGGWTLPEGRAVLNQMLHPAPAVIYSPSYIDFHPEHRRAAHCLGQVLANQGPAVAATLVRAFPSQVPLSPPLANVFYPCANVSEDRFLKEILALYETQTASLNRTIRMRHYAGALHRQRGAAEEFWELPATAFVAVHSPDNVDVQTAGFRSLRHHPIADPLAYLVGRKMRLKLAKWTERQRSQTK